MFRLIIFSYINVRVRFAFVSGVGKVLVIEEFGEMLK